MFHAKCPRCRRGNMFEGGAYHLGSNGINLNCRHCGMRFEIEPGYFYAAMYVGYAMNVAEGGSLWVATFLITGNNDSPWLYIATILGGLLVLSPLNFRYARVVLLYWLSPKVHYQPALDTDMPVSGHKNK